MNVTFHTLAALGTAAVLSSKPHAQDLRQAAAHDPLYIQAIGFGTGVVVHGLLDYIPHTYPIKAGLDVMISLVLFAGAILLAHRSHRLLIAVCFLGAIFPDLVDHGPAILSKRMGWPAPTVRFSHGIGPSIRDQFIVMRGMRPLSSVIWWFLASAWCSCGCMEEICFAAGC